jgi:hypothetical protein
VRTTGRGRRPSWLPKTAVKKGHLSALLAHIIFVTRTDKPSSKECHPDIPVGADIRSYLGRLILRANTPTRSRTNAS